MSWSGDSDIELLVVDLSSCHMTASDTGIMAVRQTMDFWTNSMCIIGDVELQNLHVYDVDCKMNIDLLYNQLN